MRITQKKFLIFLISSIFFIKNLSCTLLFSNKTAIINLQNSNSDFIIGPSSLNLDASFKNGFNIPAGQTIVLNTRVPVSGLLDLSGTLSLNSDLYFDSGLTYSGIGRIAGNGNALHLGGNLTIPNSNFFHIDTDTIIEGHGNSINLSDNAEIFVDDNVTLTLRNIVINNSRNGIENPAIKLTSNRSKLALDNTILNMANDFYVSRGQLFIHNDVSFTGTNALVYRSPMPSFITSKSTLNFDLNSIFDFRPSTTGTPQLLAKDLLFMQDATSQIHLDGGTLRTTTTGLRLTKGQIIFDNKVTLTSNSENYFTEFYNSGNPIASTVSYGNSIINTQWSPDGKYIAISGNNSPATINVYYFSGTSLTQTATSDSYGSHIRALAWNPDGKYIAVGGSTPYTVKIYLFSGNNLTQVMTPVVYGGTIRGLSWSPDGKYLAVGGDTAQTVKVYKFTGNSLTLNSTSASYGGSIYALSWSPDGNYIAAGGATTQTLNIYRFSGNNLTLVAQSGNYGGIINRMSWSPDGKHVAISGSITNALYIYYFSGNSLSLVKTANFAGSIGFVTCWSPDGKYVILSESSTTKINVYYFSGNNLTLINQSDANTILSSFSPDGKFISTSNYQNALTVYSLRYTNSSSQILSNSIIFGNSALGSNYDLNVRGLSGAQIEIDGLVNYDNVS